MIKLTQLDRTYYFSTEHQLNAFENGLMNAWSILVDEHDRIYTNFPPHELIEMAYGKSKDAAKMVDWDKVSELLTFFETAVANHITLTKMIRLECGVEVSMNTDRKSFCVYGPRCCGKTTWLSKEFHKRHENAVWSSPFTMKRHIEYLFDSTKYVHSGSKYEPYNVTKKTVFFCDEVNYDAGFKNIIVTVSSEE